MLSSTRAERGASKIGVYDDTGGVDDGLESRRGKVVELSRDVTGDVFFGGGGAVGDLLSPVGEVVLDEAGDEGARK